MSHDEILMDKKYQTYNVTSRVSKGSIYVMGFNRKDGGARND